MPSPTSALATLRPDLRGSMMEFELDMQRLGFIALQAARPIEVASASGNIGRIPIEQLTKDPETKRAPGADYARAQYTWTPDTYACEEHGIEEPIDRREARMYGEYFDAELLATQRARSIVMRALEARVAALLQSTSTWTGTALTTAVTNAWSVAGSATPITDVQGAKQYIKINSGLDANCIIIPWKAYQNLRVVTTSNQIVDRIKYAGFTDPNLKYINAAMLAEAFDLRYVLVAGAMYNTAKEGQTAVMNTRWNNDRVLVCRIAETNDYQEPCVARIFHWAEDGSTIGGAIETYYWEPSRCDIVRCRMDTDEKLLYTEAGHLLTNINGGTA